VGQRSREPEASRGSVWTQGLARADGSAGEQAGARTETAGLRASRPAGGAASGTRPAPGARTAIQEQRGGNLHGGNLHGGVRSSMRVVPAATYWRRRFVVLTAFLLVFVAAGWRMSEALSVHRGATGGAAAASGDGRAAGRGLAGSQSPQAGTVSRPNPSGTPSLSASRSGGVSPAPCPSQSIVLSLSTGQSSSGPNSYGPTQLPDFRVRVVSTQPADCSFNLGAGHLAVLIKKGTTRIWSSADCIRGSRDVVTVLKRGVPAGLSIGWGRNTSAQGCAGAVRLVSAGTYAAYAVDGSLVSAPVTLRLR
jgi:hypothetical protein